MTIDYQSNPRKYLDRIERKRAILAAKFAVVGEYEGLPPEKLAVRKVEAEDILKAIKQLSEIMVIATKNLYNSNPKSILN